MSQGEKFKEGAISGSIMGSVIAGISAGAVGGPFGLIVGGISGAIIGALTVGTLGSMIIDDEDSDSDVNFKKKDNQSDK